ncbi:MAG: diacylglycerol kinase [Acidimicrobiia bacterium]|jgi:2,4-diaminopentanoate dehydrogenase
MAYRVIQWATGTVGVHAVPAIAAHPELELVGLWVHSDAKAGRDAGELCGGPALGVTATQDAEALLAMAADCVCYTASSDLRPNQVVEDLARMLAGGTNVVNTSFVPLLYPAAAGDGVLERLEAACQEGGTTLYTSGIDPGFGNAGLAIHALALCKEVRRVRMMEIVNYATWDNPFTMFEIMGFGKTDPSQSLLLAPGSTALAWGPVLHLVARAIGLQLDDVQETHELVYADEDVHIASGTVEKGTISGMRFEIIGLVGGEERIVVEHVTRLRDDDAPGWPQGSGYRILIEGEPHLQLELSLSSDHGDHNHAGCLATAMHVVNAIPAVVEASPGVKTLLDLPVYSACVARTGPASR